MYNPKSVLQPDQLYPTLELNLKPIYLPALKHFITLKIDSEPKYHLGPEYPYKIIYDQGSLQSISLHMVYPKPMDSIPFELEKTIVSDHTCDIDNSEYFQVLKQL